MAAEAPPLTDAHLELIEQNFAAPVGADAAARATGGVESSPPSGGGAAAKLASAIGSVSALVTAFARGSTPPPDGAAAPPRSLLRVQRSRPDHDGLCSASGVVLRAVTVTPAERTQLCAAVTHLLGAKVRAASEGVRTLHDAQPPRPARGAVAGPHKGFLELQIVAGRQRPV